MAAMSERDPLRVRSIRTAHAKSENQCLQKGAC